MIQQVVSLSGEDHNMTQVGFIKEVQQALLTEGLDGWLFFDVWQRDPLSYKILKLDNNILTTRRWFYLIPAVGSPIKLVNRVEEKRLASLPGTMMKYSRWDELHNKLAEMIKGCTKIAMQYSPNNDLFNISFVDAGTIELVRSMGIDVVSSANLIQRFLSKINEEGADLHKKAGYKVQSIKDAAFQLIFQAISTNQRISELDVQQFILDQFAGKGLTCEGQKPVVAVNSHAADPHYEVTPITNVPVKEGDRILIDLWAKLKHPEAVYYDITWCGFAGKSPPVEYSQLFDIVVEARNRTKEFISNKIVSNEKVIGWQADDVCRSYIRSKGYGDYFNHRTGHSIDTAIHGSGANIDNYETKDHREIIPGSCFSIEPGIYLRELGVRTEINVLIDESRQLHVIGPEQYRLLTMSEIL